MISPFAITGTPVITRPDEFAFTDGERSATATQNWLQHNQYAINKEQVVDLADQIVKSLTPVTVPATDWVASAYAREIATWCVIGSDPTDQIMTSTDGGVTWTVTDTGASVNDWKSICWANTLGLFVAVADGAGTARVITSPDGATWTQRTDSATNTWKSICWSEDLGLLVAVAAAGTNRCMTSPDGITWTGRAIPAKAYHTVLWSARDQLFVAGATDSTVVVYTSSDGITWTGRGEAATGTAKLAYLATQGVYVAYKGAIVEYWISHDGRHWGARDPMGIAIDSIHPCEWLECFVMGIVDTDYYIYTTQDFLTYTQHSLAAVITGAPILAFNSDTQQIAWFDTGAAYGELSF